MVRDQFVGSPDLSARLPSPSSDKGDLIGYQESSESVRASSDQQTASSSEVNKNGETSSGKEENEEKKLEGIAEQADFVGLIAEAIFRDKEDVENVSEVAQHAQYNYLLENVFEKEKGKLNIRAKQAMIHMAYSDLRIRELEKQLKSLEQKVLKLPEDLDIDDDEGDYFSHRIGRSNSQGFKLSEEFLKIPHKQRPALEVLATEEDGISQSGDLAEGSSSGNQDQPSRQTPGSVRIRKQALIEHLRKISGGEINVSPSRYHPASDNSLTYPETNPMVILRPFKFFVTFEAEIRKAVKELEAKVRKDETNPPATNANDRKARRGTKDLLINLQLVEQFMDIDLKPTFDLRRQIKEGTAKSIEYHDLWHLFQLGDIVIRPSDRSTAYRVTSFTGGREPLVADDNTDPHAQTKPTMVDGFVVDCCSIVFNGSKFGPNFTSFNIRKYQGAQPIDSLPIYPIKFDSSYTELRRDLFDQGSRFLKLIQPGFVHKTLVGRTLDEPVEVIDAQVIVDITLAVAKNGNWLLKFGEMKPTPCDTRETRAPAYCGHFRRAEGCCGGDIIFSDGISDENKVATYWRYNRQLLAPRQAEELLEEDRLLLPSWAYGFILRTRRWVKMRTQDLQDVKYENNFDDLVLPDLHKETVKAMVRSHTSSASSGAETSRIGAAMDLVRAKGRGLILLLHGEPGVGKTSTAECVADLTQRPLYPITCGDIGETATEVERNLDYNFQLAHKWGCVLLLDEADVFLARRDKKDVKRNAIVSVFLRNLEYYSGILFLTTNRVGSIDPAFKSRIHISLLFPRLNLDATIKLYKILIQRAEAEQKASGTFDFTIKERDILRFAKKHYLRLEKRKLHTWNGRQIRNAFQTAIALAEYDARQDKGDTLGKEQFQTVADASEQFERYLHDTLGTDDAEAAEQEQIRYDRFETSKSRKVSDYLYQPTISRASEDSSESLSDASDISSSESDSDEKGDRRKGKKPDLKAAFEELDEAQMKALGKFMRSRSERKKRQG